MFKFSLQQQPKLSVQSSRGTNSIDQSLVFLSRSQTTSSHRASPKWSALGCTEDDTKPSNILLTFQLSINLSTCCCCWWWMTTSQLYTTVDRLLYRLWCLLDRGTKKSTLEIYLCTDIALRWDMLKASNAMQPPILLTPIQLRRRSSTEICDWLNDKRAAALFMAVRILNLIERRSNAPPKRPLDLGRWEQLRLQPLRY